MTDAQEWFASAPVVMKLSDGIVTLALDGAAAEAFEPMPAEARIEPGILSIRG